MNKILGVMAVLCLAAFVNAKETEQIPTKEQCEDYKLMEYMSLTEKNKKSVEDSCKKRYSSEHALGNCTAFEGQDLLNALKEKAKKVCK